ncbi:hypothetical protein ACHQM5_007294 [Ranunculus cassubicifolius]
MSERYQEVTTDEYQDLHISHKTLKSKISDLSYSMSITSDLSEPPDITKWFSSYAYESPVLDSEVEFKRIDSENDVIKKAVLDSEERDQLEFESPSSPCLLTNNTDLSEPPDVRNWFSSYVYESPELDTEDQSKCSFSANPETDKQGLDSKKQNQLAADGDTCLDPDPIEPNKTACLNDSDSMHQRKDYKPNETEPKSCIKQADSISNEDSITVEKTTLKKPLSWNNGDEKEVSEPKTNGFISTKKNKYSVEIIRKGLKKFQENREVKFPLKETSVVLDRKPLRETTNLQYEVVVPETTGKWRCPQRSKPDLGPPLKQLRLERWVRRV